MSYNFWIEVDTGGPEPVVIEPSFNDRHPMLDSDGFAGNALVTSGGYVRCGNYTSNVSPIWSRCLTAALDSVPTARAWIGDDDRAVIRILKRDRPIETEWLTLADLDGKPAKDAAPLLQVAVDWGIAHLDELQPLAPANGWGDVRGALTYLWDIQRVCEAHPKTTLRFSF